MRQAKSHVNEWEVALTTSPDAHVNHLSCLAYYYQAGVDHSIHATKFDPQVAMNPTCFLVVLYVIAARVKA